jgi:trans-2,3-dihydro-3-hydroxyanthranilate isomerase
MLERHYVTADVFTSRRFSGNQLAVFADGQGLTDDEMQAITREMNYSESVFVVPAANPEHTCRLRIFTPGGELPFAGHPTIGTAWVLGHLRANYVLELAAGDVEVRLDGAAGIAWMVPPKPVLGARFPADRAARLLGLVSADLASELPAQIVEIGPKFVFIGVRDLATLRRARLDQAYHRACLDEGLPVHSVFVFAPQAYSADAQYSARLFFDANGIREDPATGSANSGFAAYLHSHLKRPIDAIVEQGFEIKRPSRLYLHCDDKGLRVGGRVQPVSEGRLL